MKIGMQTWGSDGDILPMCALAGELTDVGHEVTLVVTSIDNKNYSKLSESLGFQLIHVDLPMPELSEREIRFINFILESTINTPFQILLLGNITFNNVIEEMFSVSKKLAEENDLLINYFFCHTLATASEIEGKKWITVYPAPCYIYSAHIPPTSFPNIGMTTNRLFWKMTESFIDFLFLANTNKIRKQYSLKKINNMVKNVWMSPYLNIIASSPVICDRADDWNANIQYSGFLNLPEKTQQWSRSKELNNFLLAGPPPVYMTFGSFNKISIDKNIKLFSKVAKITGMRTIIQSNWNEATFFPDSRNIFLIDTIPHREIFPLCSAIVHHGGAGTVQTALKFGLPSVVVSHGFDHTYFARALERNGAGYKPLSKLFVSPSEIAKGISRITEDGSYKKTAELLGKKIQMETGVKNAVLMIERFADKNPV